MTKNTRVDTGTQYLIWLFEHWSKCNGIIVSVGFLNEYLSQRDDEDGEGEGEEQEEAEEEGQMPDESSNTMLQNCFTAIVDTLSHHNPR